MRTFVALGKSPDQFVSEMPIAAIKYYEIGKLSQGTAAEIAGLTRTAFV